MINRALHYLSLVMLLLTALCSQHVNASGSPIPVNAKDAQQTIQREVDAALASYNIPAMSVSVWENDKQLIRITRGQREANSGVTATDQDLWHLGSCGKVITAVMILRLVDKGMLQLDIPIATYLPETLRTTMHSQLRTVTLAQLLSHTSGLYDVDWRNTIKGEARARFPNIADTAERELWQAASVVLERKPEQPAGQVFEYSNTGYLLAGFIASQVTKKPWQQVVREEVFKPLVMTTAGFGLPGSDRAIDQPRGHAQGWKWVVVPSTRVVAPNQANADPSYYGPAGLMHMSMQDWSVFMRMVLAGQQGQSNFLSKQSFARLLTPIKAKNFAEYGLGVRVTKDTQSKGTLLDHTGSNGFWRANYRVITARNRVILLAANLGNDDVDKAFEAVVKAINRELR